MNWEKAIIDPRLACRAAAFSADGEMLATCYATQAHLWLWDRGNQEFVHRDQSTGFNGYFTRLAFSPDGSLLVGGNDDKYGHLGAFFIDPPQAPAASSGWSSH